MRHLTREEIRTGAIDLAAGMLAGIAFLAVLDLGRLLLAWAA